MKGKMVIRPALAMLLSAVMFLGQMGTAGTQVFAAEPGIDAVLQEEAGEQSVSEAAEKTGMLSGSDGSAETGAGNVLDPAGVINVVHVDNAEDVQRALINNGDVRIILDADLTDYIGSPWDFTGGESYRPYWVVLGQGRKVLDLNGHSIKVIYALNFDPDSPNIWRNSYARRGSTMFRVKGGTTFELCDSKGEGKLNYTGVLSSQCSQWRDCRNVIEVDGSAEDGVAEFIMNGGSLIAGEEGYFTPVNFSSGGQKLRIVNGNALIVNDHAKVTINAGYLEARGQYINGKYKYSTGDPAEYSRTACINCSLYSEAIDEWDIPFSQADNTSSIEINDGDFLGALGSYVIMDIPNTNPLVDPVPDIHFRGGTITGQPGYMFYFADDKDKNFITAGISTPMRAFDTERFNVYRVDMKRNVTEDDIVSGRYYMGDEIVVTPKDEFTAEMWEEKGNTGINMTGHPVSFNLTDDIDLYVKWGGTDTGSWSDSIWPAFLPGDSTGYPTGENAPAHNISYDWRIYTDNTCKDNVTQIKHISNKTNKFNPKLQLNENEKAQLKEGKTYFVKCIITETWEGTHSYTVNATGTGYFKMMPYLPPVKVEFEHNLFETDLTLELGVNCDPSYLNYQKKKGYIGEYEYIVKNETSGVVYENTSTDYSDIIVPETEMKKSAVGFIDVSVEVVLYRDAEKNEKLTTDGQFKKTVTVGYLPLVTSPDDNDAAGYDKDTALGKIRFIEI